MIRANFWVKPGAIWCNVSSLKVFMKKWISPIIRPCVIRIKMKAVRPICCERYVHSFNFEFDPLNSSINLSVWFLSQPFMHLFNLLKWMGNMLLWTFIQTFIVPVRGTDCDYDSGSSADTPCNFVDDREEPTQNRSSIITRTRLYSCDQVIKLYSLSSSIKNKTWNRVQPCER